MQTAKKLAVKTVLGGKPPIPERIGESLYLYTVLGVASGLKKYTSNYGEGFGLTGEFAGFILKDGKRTGELRAPVCYLPDSSMHESLVGRVGNGDTVQFAFHVYIKAASRDVAPIGYEYTLEPIRDPEAHDPLEALEKRIAPALEGPKKDSKSKAAA